MRVEESRPLLVSASDSAPINIGEGDGPSDQARRVGRRLTSIDLLRGAIVIIMVRVLSALATSSAKVETDTREIGEREIRQHVTKAVIHALLFLLQKTIPLNTKGNVYICRL